MFFQITLKIVISQFFPTFLPSYRIRPLPKLFHAALPFQLDNIFRRPFLKLLLSGYCKTVPFIKPSGVRIFLEHPEIPAVLSYGKLYQLAADPAVFKEMIHIQLLYPVPGNVQHALDKLVVVNPDAFQFFRIVNICLCNGINLYFPERHFIVLKNLSVVHAFRKHQNFSYSGSILNCRATYHNLTPLNPFSKYSIMSAPASIYVPLSPVYINSAILSNP